MTDTFTYIPVNSPQATVTFRVKKAQFGDGYEQRSGNGINNKEATWPLEFVGNKIQMQAIMTFFDNQEGYKAFIWTPPVGGQSLWNVENYTMTPAGGNTYKVSAEFMQAFAP